MRIFKFFAFASALFLVLGFSAPQPAKAGANVYIGNGGVHFSFGPRYRRHYYPRYGYGYYGHPRYAYGYRDHYYKPYKYRKLRRHHRKWRRKHRRRHLRRYYRRQHYYRNYW